MMGFVCLLGGLIAGVYERKKNPMHAYADAKVVDLLLRKADTQGPYMNHYYPVLEYYADGNLYKQVWPEGSYPSAWHVGQTVRICYRPDDPDDYTICRDVKKGRLPVYLSTAGMIFLGAAALVFIRFAVRG